MAGALDILDQLTAQPASFLFQMDGPHLHSRAAHHMHNEFRWKSQLSPMLLHAEAGVVLYDRVVDTEQECRMTRELSKPKAARRLDKMPPPSHSKAAGQAKGCSQLAAGPLDPCSIGTAGRQGCRVAPSEVALTARPAAPLLPARLHKRRQLPPTPPSDPCVGPDNKYFRQQRATMTAASVFTWGGRLTQRAQRAGAGNTAARGASRGAAPASISPAVGGLFSGGAYRPPLRLDAYKDDAD